MIGIDPIAAAAEVNRTTIPVRDARSVLGRVDVLPATAITVNDPALRDVAALREAADRLVSQLAPGELA